MTFPDNDKCMLCHATVAKDKPAIQNSPLFAKSKRAVPWVRVYTVLPGVEWNHRAHLDAGVKCETCHGQVREMEAMAEVTSVTTMYSCLHCHEMNQAKTACDTWFISPDPVSTKNCLYRVAKYADTKGLAER